VLRGYLAVAGGTRMTIDHLAGPLAPGMKVASWKLNM